MPSVPQRPGDETSAQRRSSQPATDFIAPYRAIPRDARNAQQPPDGQGNQTTTIRVSRRMSRLHAGAMARILVSKWNAKQVICATPAGGLMGSLLRNLKQILRRLRMPRFFTTLTLITVVIGVGPILSSSAPCRGVLLKPLKLPQPDRLMGVWYRAPLVNIPNLGSPSTCK